MSIYIWYQSEKYCVEIKLYCPNNNIAEDDSHMYDYMKVFDKPFWLRETYLNLSLKNLEIIP